MNPLRSILFLILLSPIAGYSAELTSDAVQEVVCRIATTWQSENSAMTKYSWDNATYHLANLELFSLTNDTTYYDYTRQWCEYNHWCGARSDDPKLWRYDYGETDEYVLFGDNQACFQVYLQMNTLAPDPVAVARAIAVMDYEIATSEVDYIWWSDGLFMVMPLMAQMYQLTGNDAYLARLYDYWQYATATMYDPMEHLFFRDVRYLYPEHATPSGKKDFWSRGNGWALAALARTLQLLPDDAPHRGDYAAQFVAMSQAVIACQQSDGYWTRSLLDADYVPGYETSGTAFLAYALAWGVNHGLLDRNDYESALLSAWHYLTTIAIDDTGHVGYVQPIGDKAIPGQVVDQTSTANFGVAAVILAGCELVRYLTAEDAYLFVCFTSNRKEDESIHYALSDDAYNYHILNGGQPVIDSEVISSTGGVRDPHILRCEDGKTFYMVVTDMVCGKGWDSNRAMVLLKSDDLIHWQHTVINIQERYEGQDSLRRVWAPQTIYDHEAGKYMVYWSMKHNDDGVDIIYYAYANDSFDDLLGEPKPLFLPKDKKSCIDGDIVYKDGIYHLFYKTEGHGNGIRIATTTSLTNGNWIEDDEYKQQTTDDVEGAGTFKLINQDKYILMYDVYKAHRYEFTETTDLQHFTLVPEPITLDFTPRHGTIIAITRQERLRLTSTYAQQ